MSTKLKSFHYTAYTHRRGHFDDATVPPGEYVEADMWLDLHGAVLMPADKDWWEGATEEPDWDQGAFLAHAQTGRMIPGTNMAGRPMEILIEAWRSGRRTLDGVLICSETPNKKGR